MRLKYATTLGLLGTLFFVIATPAWADESAQKTRLYLAGPLGFSEAGRQFLYETLIPELSRLGYEVTDPWKLTDPNKITSVTRLPYGEARRNSWEKLNIEISKNNRVGIDHADQLVAILDGADVDSGTAAEIGYAFAKGKRIIGYRGDFRLSSDNEGSAVNIQVEYFIKESGGTIARSLGHLAQILESEQTATPSESIRENHLATVTPATVTNSSREVQDVISFFKAAFTIILALAFGEAFKQFVSDKTETQHIYRERLPALLGFFFLFMPFFQGMSRYFSATYGELTNLPQPYSAFLLIDGFNFTVEAALFFTMSRALSPERWMEFYICVLALLFFDSIWAFISWYGHDSNITVWLKLNIISVIVLFPMLMIRKYRSPALNSIEASRIWPWITSLLLVIRTIADYLFSWDYYFPRL